MKKFIIITAYLFSSSVFGKNLNCRDELSKGYSIGFDRSLKAIFYDGEETAYPILEYKVIKSETLKNEIGPYTRILAVEYSARHFSLRVDFSRQVKWKSYYNNGKSEGLAEKMELAFPGILKVNGKSSTVYCTE